MPIFLHPVSEDIFEGKYRKINIAFNLFHKVKDPSFEPLKTLLATHG